MRGDRPTRYDPADWKLSAMPRKSADCGQAAAKAMRTRVAVSLMRPAILIRRMRRVVNSAVASACDLGMASRTPSINQ